MRHRSPAPAFGAGRVAAPPAGEGRRALRLPPLLAFVDLTRDDRLPPLAFLTRGSKRTVEMVDLTHDDSPQPAAKKTVAPMSQKPL